MSAAGCRSALATIFDVPEPRAAAVPAQREIPLAEPVADTTRPPIERTLDPDSARAMLPRDRFGNIDWAAALRSGVISPRSVLPNRRAAATDFQFAFDFVFSGPDTTFDAFFPHSTHTEWLQCQQCHPRIFRYRGAPISMGDVFAGKACGECHGKVAYPVTAACQRCHRSMEMPEGGASPDFIGTLQMRRPVATSGPAVGMNADALPPALFPHWLHRIRYRCKACHMEVFEPRSGANAVTMRDIEEGRFCGACHNGVAAFPATVGTCQRCHRSPPAAPTGS